MAMMIISHGWSLYTPETIAVVKARCDNLQLTLLFWRMNHDQGYKDIMPKNVLVMFLKLFWKSTTREDVSFVAKEMHMRILPKSFSSHIHPWIHMKTK